MEKKVQYMYVYNMLQCNDILKSYIFSDVQATLKQTAFGLFLQGFVMRPFFV